MTRIKHTKMDPFSVLFIEDALRNVERALRMAFKNNPNPKGRMWQARMELDNARLMLRGVLRTEKSYD